MSASFRTVVGEQVRFAVDPYSPCPCGSRKEAAKCCLTPNGFRREPVSTFPKGEATGNRIDRCYAAALGDCGSAISREHYVSETLLKYLNSEGSLTVKGFSWTPTEGKAVGPEALASKVLCDRHNSALSRLDSIALQVFRAFDERGAAGSGKKLLHLFSGYDIERWLLKILCGLISTGSVVLDPPINLAIPDSWLGILFAGQSFHADQGLYACKSVGHRFEGPIGLSIQLIARQGNVSGIGIAICGYELVLSMSGFPSRTFDGRDFAYRPLEFYTTARDFEKSVMLTWDGPADLGTISVAAGET